MEKEGKKGSTPVLATNTPPPTQGSTLHTHSSGHKPGHIADLLLSEFLLQKNTQDMTCNYTKPKLNDSGSDWFIYFQYKNPLTGKFKRFKERFNMNRIQSITIRRQFAHEAIQFLSQKLAAGFNPYTAERADKQGDALVMTRINEVLKSLLPNASRHQAATYNLMANRLQRFLTHHHLTDLTLGMIQLSHCQLMQNWMKNLPKPLKTKTNNTTISHLGLLWDEAIRLQFTTTNPWRQVKKLRKTANQTHDVFAPITFQELTTIFEYLRTQQQHGFIRFLAIIYYAWARPIEICRLQVQDIDLQNNLIFFRTGQTKNDKSATVQIVPELLPYIQQMELHKYPPTHHLFNRQFQPCAKMITKNWPGKTWHKYVHTQLKIEKAMYALKHTGNVDYLNNNKGSVDRTWQQMQNRHSSLAQTEKYCRSLNAYYVDTNQIKFRKL